MLISMLIFWLEHGWDTKRWLFELEVVFCVWGGTGLVSQVGGANPSKVGIKYLHKFMSELYLNRNWIGLKVIMKRNLCHLCSNISNDDNFLKSSKIQLL